jgi:F0F1-type ATP synthase assembly protein I
MPDPRGLSKSLAYSGAGFSFAAIVGLSTWGGSALDESWGTAPWCTVVGGMLGVGLAMYDLFTTLARMEKKDSR